MICILEKLTVKINLILMQVPYFKIDLEVRLDYNACPLFEIDCEAQLNFNSGILLSITVRFNSIIMQIPFLKLTVRFNQGDVLYCHIRPWFNLILMQVPNNSTINRLPFPDK